MKDTELVNLITRLSEQEAMPMVADPGVIDPEAFLHEVLGERYPNPFLQDSPQRTATDTSRKIAPRFGTTLYAYYNSMLPAHRATKLIYIPLVLAGWLRYLEGVDDNGSEFTLSPDSNIEHVRALMGNPKLGDDVSEAQLYPLLANRYYFGVNLFEIGVGETVVRMFGEMSFCTIRETCKPAARAGQMDFLLILKTMVFPVIGTDRRPFQSRPKVPIRKLSPSRSQKRVIHAPSFLAFA
ncbi:MAG: hypothetical protein ACLTGV_10965 [Butyricicoccus sp.]